MAAREKVVTRRTCDGEVRLNKTRLASEAVSNDNVAVRSFSRREGRFNDQIHRP